MSSSNETNRNNSLKSTGPKTPEGKRRSCQNAVKHGIFAKNILLPAEDSQEFHFHKSGLLRRLNPRDVLESHLVEQIVADTWAIKRMRAAEQELYVDAREDVCRLEENRPEEKKRTKSSWRKTPAALLARLLDYDKMERLDRYQRRLSSSLHRSLKELRELRKEKDDPNEPLTDLAQALVSDMGSDDVEPILQNEAISDANDGGETRCEEKRDVRMDQPQDESTIQSLGEQKLDAEKDPSEVPRAA